MCKKLLLLTILCFNNLSFPEELHQKLEVYQDKNVQFEKKFSLESQKTPKNNLWFELAIKANNHELAEKYLIKGDVNILFSKKDRKRPISIAIFNEDVEMVNLLLKYHVDLSFPVFIYDNALILACRLARWRYEWSPVSPELKKIIKLLEDCSPNLKQTLYGKNEIKTT